MAPARAPGSSGAHQQARLPVGAHDFGQRAAGRGHDGDAAGHRLDGRQREALVERGHDRHLGLAVEAGQLVVADAADAVHGVGQSEAGDGLVDPATFVGTADDGQLDVALGAQLGHRLEQRHQALHRDVAARRDHDAPRHRGDVVEGAEHRVVDPDRHHRHPLRRHAHLRGDVPARVLRHRDHGRERTRHPYLHAEESEPAARGEALPRVRRVRKGQLAVDRDGVVQRRQQRPAVLDHAQHAVAQALVVVHDVELVAALRPAAGGPAANRPAARRSRPCT